MRRGRIGREGLSKAWVFSTGTVKERKEGGLQYEYVLGHYEEEWPRDHTCVETVNHKIFFSLSFRSCFEVFFFFVT